MVEMSRRHLLLAGGVGSIAFPNAQGSIACYYCYEKSHTAFGCLTATAMYSDFARNVSVTLTRSNTAHNSVTTSCCW